MGDIVNLRRARKRRDRADDAEAAARNRALFGRTAAERSATDGERARADGVLDGHRRSGPRPVVVDGPTTTRPVPEAAEAALRGMIPAIPPRQGQSDDGASG